MTDVSTGRNLRGPYKKSKLVHGVGVNDADYPVIVSAKVDGKSRTLWFCPYYNTWAGMLERCYSRKFHVKNPTYSDCSVDPAWLRFSTFKAWMAEQPWEGNQVDKDLLVQGNKVYSAAACCFIHRTVNTFILDNPSTRGAYPTGVTYDATKRKFAAQCNNPRTGKRGHIGYFLCPKEAHVAWATKKLEHATALAAEQPDPRVSAALISRFTAKYEAAVAALTSSA